MTVDWLDESLSLISTSTGVTAQAVDKDTWEWYDIVGASVPAGARYADVKFDRLSIHGMFFDDASMEISTI